MFAMVFQIKIQKNNKIVYNKCGILYYICCIVYCFCSIVYNICGIHKQKMKANFKNAISTWNFEKNLTDSKNDYTYMYLTDHVFRGQLH